MIPATDRVRPYHTNPEILNMPRLIYLVTHPMSARFLMRGQPAYMRRRGFDVTVIAAPGADLEAVAAQEGVATAAVPFVREIAPRQDLAALGRLYRLLTALKPDIVNAGTPKAGLLGMIAARAAGVPVRLYTLRGLRLETARGAKRMLLRTTEHLASACAHCVLAVSDSLRRAYVAHGLAPARKVDVLGAGSSNGIDLDRFAVTRAREAEARVLRRQLGIAPEAPVIGFVGRLTQDKGIADLVDAFAVVRARVPEAHLLLVGAFEAGDPVPDRTVRRIEADDRIVRAGFVPDAAPYYAVMDVLAFPSRREGFPNVPLEAAAAGVPTAGVFATGTVDAVAHGATGMLVPIGDTATLGHTLAHYLTNDDLRRRHGEAARTRAEQAFGSEHIWQALYDTYVRLLREKSRPLPQSAVQPAVAEPA